MAFGEVHIEDIDPYEDKLAIPYLDHDPVVCAQYTIDRDVGRGICIAAHHLSAAWTVLAQDQVAVELEIPELHKEPAPPTELDYGFVARLRGQRILRLPETECRHPMSEWTRALGGNYWWCWRWGMALAGVWRSIKRVPHQMEFVLYTLEAMPGPLQATAGEMTEPPLTMQQEYRVLDGDYYDVIASWQRYYTKRRPTMLHWTGRQTPFWA